MSTDPVSGPAARPKDATRIAVVGGGPAGSFFSYFCLDLADRAGHTLELDIYEPRDFTARGPAGCTHCGGIVSESLVQILSAAGINLPRRVVRSGIDSYVMHIDDRSIQLVAPSSEKRIAAIFRGGGPGKGPGTRGISFDHYLQTLTIRKGAEVIRKKVSGVFRQGNSWIVSTREGTKKSYDLVAGAVGLNSQSLKIFQKVLPEYSPPRTTRTFIREFYLGPDLVRRRFGTSMHIFLLNIRNLKFAALIPKGEYVTLVLLGRNINRRLVEDVLQAPALKKSMAGIPAAPCSCYPQINTRGGRHPYGDGMVLIGDCATSKLYKNGIGAAFLTAKAAAATVILQGTGKKAFRTHYRPVIRRLSRDNSLGRWIFRITGIIQRQAALKRGLVRVIARERNKPADRRPVSGILWDTFTGSASYGSIIRRALSPFCWLVQVRETLLALLYPRRGIHNEESELKTGQLGNIYQDGEIIIRQGSVGNSLYVIQAGEVEVIREEAGRPLTIARLGKDDFFGEMAIFEKDVRSSTVRAVGTCRILTIDRKTLLSTIQGDPSLAFRLLERMSRRLRDLNQEVSRLNGLLDRENG